MRALQRFWRQKNRAYRDFQLVFLLLALNFLIPGLSYLADPGGAIRGFEALGRAMGGGPYPLAAWETGWVWRVLAAGNVLTLAFMCGLLLADLRRFYPVVYPLAFMKGFASAAYLTVYLRAGGYPAFLAVSLWDAATVAVMVFFASRARRSLG